LAAVIVDLGEQDDYSDDVKKSVANVLSTVTSLQHIISAKIAPLTTQYMQMCMAGWKTKKHQSTPINQRSSTDLVSLMQKASGPHTCSG